MRSILLAPFVLLSAPALAVDDVAVTEFIRNPTGTDSTHEWLELYNYGGAAVDLEDWTLTDDDTNTFTFPAGVSIGPGAFLILSPDPAAFVANWGVGTAGTDVILLTSFTIANGDDEIILSDPSATEVWRLAYVDDEVEGIATYLTSCGFTIGDFGTKAMPGIDSDGDDNGIPGFLGYENNTATTDPFAFAAGNGDEGSPLAGPDCCFEICFDVELAGVLTPGPRCIHFVTDDCAVAADVTLMFTDHDASDATPVRAVSSIVLPCGAWTFLSAKDRQHTKWDTTTLTLIGDETKYETTSLLSLRAGDTDDDGDMDINDVTLLLAQLGGPEPFGDCPWNGMRGADFDNSGMVSTEDFSLFTPEWLTESSSGCTSPIIGGGRVSVPTAELDPIVAARADLNADGVVDVRDVKLFERRHGLPATLSRAMEFGIGRARPTSGRRP